MMGMGSPDYKPIALRWPLLLPFVLYLCGLIAVLEFTHRSFPSARSRDNNEDELPIAPKLLSAPLINAHAPTPKPAPTSPSLGRTVRRRGNDTESGVAQSPNNQSGVMLIARQGFPPPTPFFNETYSNTSSARRARNLRPRVQDSSLFAKFSGPASIIRYMISLGTTGEDDARKLQILYYGQDYVDGAGYDDVLCAVTCDGPALVFHEPRCYHDWEAKGNEIQEWRALDPTQEWLIQEQELDGGGRCQDSPGARVQVSVKVWEDVFPFETSTYYILSEFAAATTVTERGPDGSPTATVTVGLPPTPTVVPLVDVDGRTTAMSTVSPEPLTTILRDAKGVPTRTLTASVNHQGAGRTTMTLRDSLGVPTATITGNTGPVFTTMTLRDSHGVPTATITAEVSPGVRVVTLTDSNGVPTATMTIDRPGATSTSGPGSSIENILHHIITPTEYWMAYFLPVLLTTVVAILAQVVSSDIRVMMPFHNLTRQGGVPASQSLLIPTGVINDYITSFRFLTQLGDPLPLLGDILVLLSAVVTALSSEAVGIKLYGSCGQDSFTGCFMGIAVITAPAIALKVLLCVELVVLVLMWVLLTRWRTGVASVPHSIAATVSLVQDPGLRRLFHKMEVDERTDGYVRDNWIINQLKGHVFSLGSFQHRYYSVEDYGVRAREVHQPERKLKTQSSFRLLRDTLKTRTDSFKSALTRTMTACRSKSPAWLINQPTTHYLSLLGLGLFCGLLALLLYYENTRFKSRFEDFMMDQNFGARFLFTVIGIGVSFFWSHYSAAISILEPYRLLSAAPQPAPLSILISPSTAAFTDIGSALARRGWFVSLTHCSVVLSNLTPTLLSGVPFSPTQTWLIHQICAWAAIGSLGVMVVNLVCGAIWVRYPRMPLDPGSLAGRIYYVCDSAVVRDFRGTSRLKGKEFRKRVGKEKRYRFGKMVGVSGGWRIGVDYDNMDRVGGLDEKMEDVDF